MCEGGCMRMAVTCMRAAQSGVRAAGDGAANARRAGATVCARAVCTSSAPRICCCLRRNFSSQNAVTLPRPPSVFAGGRSKTLLQHLDAAGTIAPQQRSTTAASPQRSQAARHAAGSLASTGDSAASASTIEKIWPSKTTTPAAASPDPCLGATNGRKIACEVLFTLLAVFGRATHTTILHTIPLRKE